MAGIRSKDTVPEMLVRRGLHAIGFRYRLHDRKLPGNPDMVFPGRHAVIFIHGCFWHGHDCHLFKWPSSRREFWKRKISRNRSRDKESMDALYSGGWRALVVWECALKGKERIPLDVTIARCAKWLRSGKDNFEIRGATV